MTLKNKPGRPRIGFVRVGVILSPDQLQFVDAIRGNRSRATVMRDLLDERRIILALVLAVAPLVLASIDGHRDADVALAFEGGFAAGAVPGG